MKVEIPPGIKLGTAVPATVGDDELRFLRQLGMGYVRVHFAEDADSEADVLRIQRRFRAAGLEIFCAVHPVYKAQEIALGQPGRDAKIAVLARFLHALGNAGIHTLDYDFFLYAPLPSTGTATRRGAQSREFDLDLACAMPRAFDRDYSDVEMWENYTYFMNAILPAAEKAGVRLALHQDDPPVPSLLGVARIFRDIQGFQRVMKMTASPAWGVLFCVGTWAEGGEAMGMELCEAIRFFAARGRLFTVHFRNISAPLPHFVETFLDDGYVDMYRVMRTLVEVGFDGLLIPDHWPELTGEGALRAGLAYSVGYMRALLERAQAEVGR